MDEKTVDVANDITVLIENGQRYDSLYYHLKKLKEDGFSKEQVYEALEFVRTKYIKENNEEKEDTILELMDIASNYCSPRQRIGINTHKVLTIVGTAVLLAQFTKHKTPLAVQRL